MHVSELEYFLNDDKELRFRCMTEDGVKVIDPDFEHYYYIDRSNETKVKTSNAFNNVQIERDGAISVIDKKPLTKLVFSTPYLGKTTRDYLDKLAIVSHESDIDIKERWMIDRNITPPTLKPKNLLSFDIETDARKEFPKWENPFQRIISIGCVDGVGKRVFLCDDDERKMLLDFASICSKYHIATGWNIDKFDIPYINARAERLRISPSFGLCSFIDGMTLYGSSEFAYGNSLRLDDVIKRELGITIKESHFDTQNKMQELWDSFVGNREKLESYCMEDTSSVKDLMISQDHRLMDLAVEKCRIANTRLQNATKMSKLVEALKLKFEFNRTPRHIFQRKEWVSDEIDLEGGYVFTPVAGLHDWVAIIDFSGMYSRIMRMFNVDLESKARGSYDADEVYVAPNGAAFYREPACANSNILTMLEDGKMSNRVEQWKYKMGTREHLMYYTQSAAYKVLGLSFYGVLGSPYSRFFDIEISNAITAWGRMYIKGVSEIAKRLGYVTVYGDTDSVMIGLHKSGDEAQKEMEWLADELNKSLMLSTCKAYNMPKEHYIMSLEGEKLFRKFYVAEKKRYVGEVYTPANKRGELYSKGLELIKYGVFPLLKTTQVNMFTELFNSETMDKANAKMRVYFADTRQALFKGELDDKLVMKRGVRRAIADYSVDGPHVQAAKILAEKNLFREGDIVNYVVISTNKGKIETYPVIDDVIPHIEPSGYQYYYDRLNKMRNNVFSVTMKRNIFEIIGVKNQ